MYNNVYVGLALDILVTGLRPFVERQFQTCYGDSWRTRAAQTLRRDPESQRLTSDSELHLDVYALLALMKFHWKEVFWNTLGPDELSHVNLLRGVRNRWAHQEPFSIDDSLYALHTIERLLAAIPAPAESNEVARLKRRVLSIPEKGPSPENGDGVPPPPNPPEDGVDVSPPPPPNPPVEYIVQPSRDQRVVEVWSACLLPFEPKGRYLDLRKDIRDGIHALPENPDGVLHAICGTPQQPNEKWDVENILLLQCRDKLLCSSGTAWSPLRACILVSISPSATGNAKYSLPPLYHR